MADVEMVTIRLAGSGAQMAIDVGPGGPLADVIAEAERLHRILSEQSVKAKLLGGVGVHMICPSARHEPLRRSYNDLDFAAPSAQRGALDRALAMSGYQADRSFNALHGHSRLLYWDEQNQRQVDVFFNQLQLCHRIDLSRRLDHPGPSLRPADLLLTKLQIIEMNPKDMMDAAAILTDHDLCERGPQGIDVAYLTGLVAGDWGLWKTASLGLEKVSEFAATSGYGAAGTVIDRARRLKQAFDTAPKSLKWKLRAVVGERVPWYELPEEKD